MIKIIALILLTVSPLQQQWNLDKYLTTSVESFKLTVDITYEVYRQSFFDNVTFYEVDTVTWVTTSPNDDPPRQVLAIDKNSNIYQITGYDQNQFDSIISNQRPSIHIDNIRMYGKFYLEVTSPMNLGYLHFIDNATEFMTLSDELFEIRYGYPYPKRDEEKKLIDSFGIDNQILFKCDENKYIINYYLWNELKGSITKYIIEITDDGYCSIISKDVLVEKIGCWRSYPRK